MQCQSVFQELLNTNVNHQFLHFVPAALHKKYKTTKTKNLHIAHKFDPCEKPFSSFPMTHVLYSSNKIHSRF